MKILYEVAAEEEGRFLSRPNRFLARVSLKGGEIVEVHLRDPGRLPDLALPGRRVLLRRAIRAGRRTAWDLLAFERGGYWCFCHSGYHRPLAANLLFEMEPFGKIRTFQPEPRVKDGRLDFFLETEEGEFFIEVKGVTWAREGRALFPDAPTERGLRHLQTLRELLRRGKRAGLMFLVFRPEAREVRAAEEIHPSFAKVLSEAYQEGLRLKAFVLSYDGRYLSLEKEIPVKA